MVLEGQGYYLDDYLDDFRDDQCGGHRAETTKPRVGSVMEIQPGTHSRGGSWTPRWGCPLWDLSLHMFTIMQTRITTRSPGPVKGHPKQRAPGFDTLQTKKHASPIHHLQLGCPQICRHRRRHLRFQKNYAYPVQAHRPSADASHRDTDVSNLDEATRDLGRIEKRQALKNQNPCPFAIPILLPHIRTMGRKLKRPVRSYRL